MSGISGPKIITSGCVLSLDAADKLSYKGSGTSWYDLSGNSNTGTLTNGPTFSAGNQGNIVFDGVDDYLITANQPLTNNSSFTLECFVNFPNFNDNTYRSIIDSGNFGVGTLGYSLSKDNSNKLYVAVNNGYSTVNTTLNSNTWYHIVATATLSANYVFTIYVNAIAGTQISSANSSALTTNQTSIKIASNYVGTIGYYSLKMSLFRVYNRALSASEVLQNYNATKNRFGY